MFILPYALATFFSTLSGGLLAMKFEDRLHFILSFTAGVLLGVVCFDLLPEIFEMAQEHKLDPMHAMVALVAGFLTFHGIEKYFAFHHVHKDDKAADAAAKKARNPNLGTLSAGALVVHSFIDGMGMGLAFQVSPATGAVVALAVIFHAFCDGINTVGLMLVNKNTKKRAFAMLLLDAVAPVFGVLVGSIIVLPTLALMVFLGYFAGFLLYIGAADILPEAHSRDDPSATVFLIGLTCLGAGLIYLAIHMLH